jgi:hypothetical protein
MAYFQCKTRKKKPFYKMNFFLLFSIFHYRLFFNHLGNKCYLFVIFLIINLFDLFKKSKKSNLPTAFLSFIISF